MCFEARGRRKRASKESGDGSGEKTKKRRGTHDKRERHQSDRGRDGRTDRQTEWAAAAAAAATDDTGPSVTHHSGATEDSSTCSYKAIRCPAHIKDLGEISRW